MDAQRLNPTQFFFYKGTSLVHEQLLNKIANHYTIGAILSSHILQETKGNVSYPNKT